MALEGRDELVVVERVSLAARRVRMGLVLFGFGGGVCWCIWSACCTGRSRCLP
jgi:hypothetical protein